MPFPCCGFGGIAASQCCSIAASQCRSMERAWHCVECRHHQASGLFSIWQLPNGTSTSCLPAVFPTLPGLRQWPACLLAGLLCADQHQLQQVTYCTVRVGSRVPGFSGSRWGPRAQTLIQRVAETFLGITAYQCPCQWHDDTRHTTIRPDREASPAEPSSMMRTETRQGKAGQTDRQTFGCVGRPCLSLISLSFAASYARRQAQKSVPHPITYDTRDPAFFFFFSFLRFLQPGCH
jgi:hypothetical protein